MFRLLVILVMICFAWPLSAQQSAPSTFRDASSAFGQFSTERRVYIQMLLTAAGYWLAVPNVDFSQRLFSSIRQFQRENGFPENGILDEPHIARLESRAAPMLNLWGFRAVSHPQKLATIWVPFGLGLTAKRNEHGLVWSDPQNRVGISFSVFQHRNLKVIYDALIAGFVRDGSTVHFKVLRPDFFAISVSEPNGVDSYYRFHQRGSNHVGFAIYWNSSEAQLHIERVATLMSGSLWSSMTGAPFPRVPAESRPTEATIARTAPPPTFAAPGNAPPTNPAQEPRRSSSGSGFFVSSSGHIVTNAHVVDGCSTVTVTPDGAAPLVARILARDTTNDLALLQVSTTPKRVVGIRTGARLGEQVAVFGFPLASILASSGNFTLGNITALAGLGDDSRYLQISAPVQPGNSGGPLFDQSGNLVGVVAAKLNALRTMVATQGDIPQNVNFAIKASVAANFLETNRLSFQPGQATTPLQPADLAEQARATSVFIRC